MPLSRRMLVPALLVLSTGLIAAGPQNAPPPPPPPNLPPIEKVDGVPVKGEAFQPRGWSKPHELNSAADAEKLLGKAAADKLSTAVIWKRQKVLVFAWRGSGQDKLKYGVQESYPEQIAFQYAPGRTRDLRPHLYVYALRKNVTWKVHAQR